MLNKDSKCPIFRYMDVDKCCGCEVCTNICPTQALVMTEDEEGFLYPILDESKCISCDKCVQTCPMHNSISVENEIEQYFEFSHTDNEILLNSASGGVFTYIYNLFIKQYPNGYVAGAVYTKDCKRIIHILSDRQADVYRMRGSKYFQSCKGEIYKNIKDLLNKKIPVMFSGAPCEVDALYRFLGKDYNILWTIDYICKGSSTPRMLMEYIGYLNDKMHSDAVNINMRFKWPGMDNWIPQFVRVQFKNGRKFFHEFYNTELGICFQIMQRKSCSDCPYREKLHPADFTMGDLHEDNRNDPVFNHMGTSIVILNTFKSNNLWSEWDKTDIKYREITKEEVYGHNRNPVDPRNQSLRNNLKKYNCVMAVRNTIGFKEKIKMAMPVMPLRKITAWRREHKK